MSDTINAVNLQEKFSLFTKHWNPKLVGKLNKEEVKVVKIKGEFVWHDHKDTDELFLVIKGQMIMHLRDKDISLSEGELIIIPKGVEHKPEAPEEAHILLMDSEGTVNTGEVKSELTSEPPELI